MCSRAAGKNGSRRGNEINVQRPTSNAEHRIQQVASAIRRSVFGVRCSTLMLRHMNTIAEGTAPSTLKAQTSNIPRFAWRIVDFLIGGLFIYAGAIKALDPIQFGIDIDKYK